MDFVVPLHPEDLEYQKPDRLYVRSVLDVENCPDIDGVIDGLSDTILNASDIFKASVDSNVFDKIYSLVKYWSCHGGSTKQRVIELLFSHVQEILSALADVPAPANGSAQGPETALRRSAFKAIMYMYATAVQVADKTSVPQSIVGANAKGAAGKKGAKGKAPAAVDLEDEVDVEDNGADVAGGADKTDANGGFDWPGLREPCIRLMVAILSADLRKLWSLGLPEEEFIGAFTKTGARLVTNALSMKDKDSRRAVVDLLSLACWRFGPSTVTPTVAAIVDAITKYEHAPPIAADVAFALGSATSKTHAPHVVSEMLREIGSIGHSSGGSSGGAGAGADAASSAAGTKDSAGLRRAAAFIMDVSERIPSLVLANMSVLLPYLDCESHALRTALVTTLGNIVATTFNTATEASAASGDAGAADGGAAAQFNASTRDTLLDVMQQRAYDVHSYSRAAVLRAWVSLAGATAIPVSRLPATTSLAIDRLMDKASIVRKTSAQLLRSLLENNPFGPRIDAVVFNQQVAAAGAWLAANAPAVWAQLSGMHAGKQQSNPSKNQQPKGLKSIKESDDDGDEDVAEVPDGDDALNESLVADAAAEMEAGNNGGAAGEAAATMDVIVTPEAAKVVAAREMCLAASKFAVSVASAVPTMVELLHSKTGSDVMEAIRFLASARSFQVPGAEAGLARMLVLVWKDGPVREEVVRTFDKLYILNEALDGNDDADGDGAVFGAPAGDAVDGVEGGATAVEAGADDAATAPAVATAGGAATSRRSSRARTTSSQSLAELDDDEDEDDDDAPAAKSRAAKGKKSAATAAAKPKAAPKSKAAAGASSKASTKATSASSRANIDPSVVADNLIKLISGSSIAVCTSLEEVIKLCSQRGLIPSTVLASLWEFVAVGIASHVRTRIAVGSFLQTCSAAKAGANVIVDTPASMSQLKSHNRGCEAVLQRARSAMCIVGMAAAASPETVDSLAGLKRLYAVMHALQVPGLPVGQQLAYVATRVLPATASAGSAGRPSSSSSVDLSILDQALCAGDYRLARHACAALQRLAGSSVAASPKKTMAGASSSAAPAAAAPAPTSGKPPTGKAAAAAATKAAAAATAEAAAAEERKLMLSGIIECVAGMIRGDWDGGDVENSYWYAAAQQGIDAIFALAPQPVAICTSVLQSMAAGALVATSGGGNEPAAAFAPNISTTRMSRLFFVLGHVALKTLVHVEALATRVKLLRIKAADKLQADHAAGSSSGAASSAGVAAGGKAKGKAASAAANKNSAANDGIEEQLGVSAAEDEKESELVVQIADREMMAGNNLAAVFAPLLTQMAYSLLQQTPADGLNEGTSSSMMMAQSALLALSKFMCVSSDFCESHLQLLFTVLSKASNPRIRGMIAISLGDLAFRFPNLIEPYTHHLYARLRDNDAGVRKNTLMVLTHLILNDMVKVKGKVGEIAICLNDDDQRIADLTRLFFTELSKRGNNPIYNILPDTLSCLSKLQNDPASILEPSVGGIEGAGAGASSSSSSAALPSTVKALDPETFRDVVKFLLSFINKDKQSDSLSEKLLHRLESSDDPGLWRDVSYCLSQLPLSEKSIRKMGETVRGYKKALADDDVWECFSGMLARARKMAGIKDTPAAAGAASSSSSSAADGNAAAGAGSSAGAAAAGAGGAKADLRACVEEWERALLEARSGATEDDSAITNARNAARRAMKIAAVSGMDAAAITAQAMAHATASVSAAAAAAEAGAAGKNGSSGVAARGSKKAAVTASAAVGPAVAGRAPLPPSSSAAAAGKLKKKGIVADDDSDDDDGSVAGSVASRRSSVASASSAGVGPAAAPKRASAAASKASAAATVEHDDDDVVQPKRKTSSASVGPAVAATSKSSITSKLMAKGAAASKSSAAAKK